jgi:hypothetical protein
MSGLDEQNQFAPECPCCGKCKEWNIGSMLWLLTEAATKERNLKYPSIYYKERRMDDIKLRDIFRCSTCLCRISHTSPFGKKLTAIFYAQRGKPFHVDVTDGSYNKHKYRIWE